MNNTQSERIEEMLRKMDKKLDMLLYEDDVDQPKEILPGEDIYTKGQRVPYVKLDDVWINDFRDFLAHIRMNESFYSEREVEFASYADKNFDDIRLSENSKRILESAYFKTYKRNWPFTFVKGYLHKLGMEKAWSWADGKRG